MICQGIQRNPFKFLGCGVGDEYNFVVVGGTQKGGNPNRLGTP